MVDEHDNHFLTEIPRGNSVKSGNHNHSSSQFNPKTFYDKAYFTKGTKSNYGGQFAPYNRRHFYPYAESAAKTFKKLFKQNHHTVLVLGCARGFLVEAMRIQGFDTYGIDISTWAIQNATPKSKPFLHLGDITEKTQWQNEQFDLLIAEDVLEHIPQEKLEQCLNEATRLTKKTFIIKVITQDPTRKDQSHITLLPTEKWIQLLTERNWRLIGKEEVTQKDQTTALFMIWTKTSLPPQLQKPHNLIKIKDTIDGDILRWYGNKDTPIQYEEHEIIKNKKVLVLIPTHNNASLLRGWFNYLYKLDPQPTEYIFLENNSTDETVELIRNFKRPHKLIQLHFDEKKPIPNGESAYYIIAQVRQRLLEYARKSNCDYAIFFDTDVFPITQNIIQHLTDWNVDLVGGKYMRFFPNGLKIASYWYSGNPNKPFRLREHTQLPFEEVICTSAGCLCLSKKLIQDHRINFYPINAPFGTSEDFGYCHQARQYRYKVYLDSLVDLRHLSASDRSLKPWTADLDGKCLPFSYSQGTSQDK